MKSKILKKTNLTKLHFGRSLKLIGTLLLTATILASCNVANPGEDPQYQQQIIHNAYQDLPSKEEALENLENALDGNANYLHFNGSQFWRMPCPTDTEAIKVNINFKPNDFTKKSLELCIEEFNILFEAINPNYIFELNYSPTEQDLLNPYSIDVFVKSEEDLIYNSALGTTALTPQERTEEIEGAELYNTSIQLHNDCLNSYNLINIFKHEFLHTLGFADAYELDSTINTIMQKCKNISSNFTLSQLDVLALDALYHDPNTSFLVMQQDFQENYSSYKEKLSDFIASSILKETVDINSGIYTKKLDSTETDHLISLISDPNTIVKVYDFQNKNLGEVKGTRHPDFARYYLTFGEDSCSSFARSGYSDLTENRCPVIDGDLYDMRTPINIPDLKYVYIQIEDYIFELSCYKNNAPKFSNIYKETTMTAEEYFDYTFGNIDKVELEK